jgi:hypothetical protein
VRNRVMLFAAQRHRRRTCLGRTRFGQARRRFLGLLSGAHVQNRLRMIHTANSGLNAAERPGSLQWRSRVAPRAAQCAVSWWSRRRFSRWLPCPAGAWLANGRPANTTALALVGKRLLTLFPRSAPSSLSHLRLRAHIIFFPSVFTFSPVACSVFSSHVLILIIIFIASKDRTCHDHCPASFELC